MEGRSEAGSCRAAEIAAVSAESRARHLPHNRRKAPHGESRGSAEIGFFGDNGASLLIVPALFFIQRRNGEVAEWSKALPC